MVVGSVTESAYVFEKNGTTWHQTAKLVASDAAYYDYFGMSVAISGDIVVVGAAYDDDGGSGSGSAYVFEKNRTAWEQTAKLVASDASTNDYFGQSVAISGDIAIVGSYKDGFFSTGSAYVFEKNRTAWDQTAKLVAYNAYPFDYFGQSVAISGDIVVVGAVGSNSGSAYVFEKNRTAWDQTAKLVASDAAAGDNFGQSVAISGYIVVVGAVYDDDGGSSSGSAYVFEKNRTAWDQTAKLVAPDAAAGDNFGKSVAISGDIAIVGVYWDDEDGSDSGSAYVFEKNRTAWDQTAKLVASDAAANDNFGLSVAISGDNMVVGAPVGRSMFMIGPFSGDSGAAYPFSLD